MIALSLFLLAYPLSFKGKVYNIESLAKEEGTFSLTVEDEEVFFNPLKVINLTAIGCTDAQEANVTVASKAPFGEGDFYCFVLGLKSSETPKLLEEGNGLSIEYNGGASNPGKFTFLFQCAKEEGTPALTRDKEYNYFVNWSTKAACGKGGGSDVFGIVFFIILLVAATLYFAIGIPICACGMKKRGKEIIPFIHFWIALPGLFKDGVKCMFSPCCKSKSGYDEVIAKDNI
ncbi:hypothetical protein BLNAU_1823 [Blattamonas nauphoetae]|uniref:Autophagy-related protein 27 n=1 Tax=Blattamonas nauphoetae TaxID=2049346 RepID=A0ABQ9YI14_9EUKA|nr:hypothetical protein BLNAU_1823 [Blattamonas nauphoetae]